MTNPIIPSEDGENSKQQMVASSPKYEPFSRYYLHPSEGTSTVISPILLKDNNYDEWVRSIRNNLRAKNKLCFIDGTLNEPDATSPDFEQ
ncbi:hypothetical protein LIER_29633 [Lithospermum erythrorhizon]|uniref:Retrotransposon Copia-like N-terminal domain-containing protein n=1 Tax=Lithospermum erythrorhizon TaxID=34254 RepID=A0AAV3RNG1_LITER